MKYEYKEIYEGEAGPRIINQINEMGKKGWRVVNYYVSDISAVVLLERVVEKKRK